MLWVALGIAILVALGYFLYRMVKFQGVKAETVDKEWHG